MINNNIFFVISTGRSGTKTITNTLTQNSNITCLHEPHKIMIKISTLYEHGIITRKETKTMLYNLYKDILFSDNTLYGEVDLKYFNLIDILYEIFPNAKFIWLIRKPENVIKSTFYRGWFNDNEYGLIYRKNVNVNGRINDIYTKYRLDGTLIKNKLNSKFIDNWYKLTPFDKNCWYYFYVNKKIGLQLKNKQHIKINLENIETDIHRVNEFLGLPSFNYELYIYNTANYIMKDLKPYQLKTINNYKNIFECQ